MVTPELIGYIKGEFAKGRKREDIRADLVKEGGGWSEVDLNEAFRTVLPMQGFTPSSITPSIATTKVSPASNFTLKKVLTIIAVVLIIGGVGYAGWFYRSQLKNFWASSVNKVIKLSGSVFSPKKNNTETANTVPQNNQTNPGVTNTTGIKNCGNGTAPDLKNSLSYENDSVLNCMGDSALNCVEARAILKDSVLPTVFQIVKNKNTGVQNTCNFKLSYGEDSTLMDVNGRKLAGQYITCPVNMVKAIDETKSPTLFMAPSIGNPSKYASQIYFYGALGVFIENNLDQSKIQMLGCSGEYISSIIGSYQKSGQ